MLPALHRQGTRHRSASAVTSPFLLPFDSAFQFDYFFTLVSLSIVVQCSEEIGAAQHTFQKHLPTDNLLIEPRGVPDKVTDSVKFEFLMPNARANLYPPCSVRKHPAFNQRCLGTDDGIITHDAMEDDIRCIVLGSGIKQKVQSAPKQKTTIQNCTQKPSLEHNKKRVSDCRIHSQTVGSCHNDRTLRSRTKHMSPHWEPRKNKKTVRLFATQTVRVCDACTMTENTIQIAARHRREPSLTYNPPWSDDSSNLLLDRHTVRRLHHDIISRFRTQRRNLPGAPENE